MKDRKKSSTTYYLMLALVFILFAGLIGVSYYMLQLSVDKVAKKNSVLARYSEEERKISKLLTEYSEVKAQQEILAAAIPDKENFVGFIESIENVAAMVNLPVTVNLSEGVVVEGGVTVDVQTETTKRINKYAGITTVEVLEGGISTRISPDDFGKVIDFIGLLADMKYYSRLTDFKFTTAIDEAGVEFLDVVITMNLYVKSSIETK